MSVETRPTTQAYRRGFSDGEEWGRRPFDARRMEAEFWNDSELWVKQGSGMTKEQEVGAAMAWSWLRSKLEQAFAERAGFYGFTDETIPLAGRAGGTDG